MSWTQPRFTPDGQVIVSPMVGPWDQYEKGSAKWAEAIAAHLQGTCRRTQDPTDPKRITMVLKEALFSDPPPWEVWPEEANGNPEAWVRMVTLLSWSEVEKLVISRLDEHAWQPFAQALGRWEADYRTEAEAAANRERDDKGRFIQAPVSPGDGRSRDDDAARGIRRRLQKRAKAGDEQATALVEQLATGQLTVNQAAIAAGMRQRYFRVPLVDDPVKVAAAIRKHLTPEQLAQLVEALTASPN
jgi:hypothetical protein